jgi:hypothetical protein
MQRYIIKTLGLGALTVVLGAALAQNQPTAPPPTQPGAAAPGTVAPAAAPPAAPLLMEQSSTPPPQEAAPAKPKPKKPAQPTHRGKLTAADKIAMTFTVESKEKTRTFQVTSQTRFIKGGKPATFGDAELGGQVVVAYKQAKKGKTAEALTVRFASKPGAAQPAGKAKKESGEKKPPKDKEKETK